MQKNTAELNELADMFAVFNETTESLRQSHEMLQAKVAELSEELLEHEPARHAPMFRKEIPQQGFLGLRTQGFHAYGKCGYNTCGHGKVRKEYNPRAPVEQSPEHPAIPHSKHGEASFKPLPPSG